MSYGLGLKQKTEVRLEFGGQSDIACSLFLKFFWGARRGLWR